MKDGCEGLMVKMLDSDASYYEPSRRSVNWLKVTSLQEMVLYAADICSQLKKDYLAGVGDSLDLVVVGGYYGKGKRTNVYGAFLLACYDSDSEAYQTICKIGTGFSEEILQSHYETLKPLELTKGRGDITVGGAKPDVWFEPKIVWEVLTADLSLSPIYTAAQGLVRLCHCKSGRLLFLHRWMREEYHYDFLDLSVFERTSQQRMQLGPNKLQRCTKDKSLRKKTARRRVMATQMMGFGNISEYLY